MIITRFAPSPTGHLHLGHAYSVLFAYEAARREGGKFILRIEDIDKTRCRPEFTDAIFEDLRWLGLTWSEPVLRQSEHLGNYHAAFEGLREKGVVYPCFCTRKEVAAEAASAAGAPHVPLTGPDGPIYSGTCWHLSQSEREEGLKSGPANWRLDIKAALRLTGPLFWRDRGKGEVAGCPQDFGDVVIARKDIGTSYHLSVTVDDHMQDVTLVTRGEDLLRSTDIHRLLQALLGYAAPDYHHHKILMDDEGKRFAKRDQSVTLQNLRENGMTAEEIRRMAGF